MKVREIPYQRYTIEEAREAFAAVEAGFKSAKSADDVIVCREQMLRIYVAYAEAASLSNCRFTLNTRDKFYSAEMGYYDETSPLFDELMVKYADLMLESPYRKELEKKINPRLFRKYELAKKSFSPAIIGDIQEENAMVTEYSKFMSEMVFCYEGKEMPLSVLRGKLEDTDRAVRRAACNAIGEGLAKNAEKLDDIYDRLVKIRTQMAKKLGYENFIELGYCRMNRLDYNAEMVTKFRENVRRDLVPCIGKLKAETAEEMGWDKFMFYDNEIYTKGESPKPHLDHDGMFAAATQMYDDMNSGIGAFMHSMMAAEAFDVESRDGKWGGGYCTGFPAYKQPFILANWNGGCGDVDVLTHEFGHALAAHFSYEEGDIELDVGGMETAECHSMSMEFLAEKYMDKFFGPDADKYRYRHMLDALSFIPYGVIVDEFQHIVYENPSLTPGERKAAYRGLEEKYRPYLSFEGIPYLEEGTRWQYQMHIYESPFYYIDYCLAQTVALNFLIQSKEDHDGALARYLRFARQGGTKAFTDLVAEAGIPSPFEDGALKTMADKIMLIAEELRKKIAR